MIIGPHCNEFRGAPKSKEILLNTCQSIQLPVKEGILGVLKSGSFRRLMLPFVPLSGRVARNIFG
jgi:hypothetical protein